MPADVRAGLTADSNAAMPAFLTVPPDATFETVRQEFSRHRRRHIVLELPPDWTELDNVARMRLLLRQAQAQQTPLALVTRHQPARKSAAIAAHPRLHAAAGCPRRFSHAPHRCAGQPTTAVARSAGSPCLAARIGSLRRRPAPAHTRRRRLHCSARRSASPRHAVAAALSRPEFHGPLDRRPAGDICPERPARRHNHADARPGGSQPPCRSRRTRRFPPRTSKPGLFRAG